MKTASKISALLLAVSLTAGLQARASVIFTESLNNIDAEVFNTTYTGTFTDANLLSGSTVYNSSLYTISSAVVDVTMLNAAGHQTSLIIDGITLNETPTTSPQTLVYTLNSTQDNYIAANDGTFNFGVTADCELMSAKLILTTTSNTPPVAAPEVGSTSMLLGAALSVLGLLKRKLA